MKKILLVSFLSCLLSSPILAAAAFTYTTLDDPNVGVTLTQALGVNDNGVIVGRWQASSSVNHAFTYTNGSFTDLIPPGAPPTVAVGINNSTEIVGATGAAPTNTNFVDISGTFTPISISGAISSEGTGVTTCGQVVGVYAVSGAVKGFSQSCPPSPVLTTGIVAPAGPTVPTVTSLSGVNDSGLIVGFANPTSTPSLLKGFTLSAAVGGTFSAYFVAPVSGTSATNFAGVDSAGDIVGYYQANGVFHGFILIGGIGGTFQTIDDPDPSANGTKVFGISPNGKRIVGAWTDGGGGTHGFVGVAVLPTVAIDTPTNGANVGGNVTVSGWALDNATAVGTAISGVQVLVDGVSQGAATYGISRPDVCAVYAGRPGCPNVGYTFTLNTASLSAGAHTLTVSATDTDSPADAGSLSITIKVLGPPTVNIDSPSNGATVSGNVTVNGWALDNATAVGTAISSVQVFVDGVSQGAATYGISRTDVCAAFPGRPGCPNVGFTFSLNISSISAGAHTLRVSATDSDTPADTGSASISFNVGTAAPTVVSAVPASGSGSAQTFTLTVADGAGAANISLAYFLVNSSLSAANGCFVEVNRAANTFRLQNDAGSGWLGPITLGSNASLSNSQCTITGNGASSIAAGNNLAITIPTSFAFAFGGAKTVFGFAFDNAFVGSGWINTGAWNAPTSGGAAVVSAAPSSGSNSAQAFTLTVADGAGAANISSAYFLVNASLSGAAGCFVEYNHAANTFRLQNDAGSGWLGPITLGSTASLFNSQCTITGNGASTIAAGNNLTITIPTSFASAFSGAKTVFAFAFDNASVGSGWITTGSWTVPSSGGAAVVSAAPASGSGSAQTFTLTVADGAGAANISSAYFLINSSLSAASGCFVEVNRAANTFRLQNDAGSGWLGPITLGTTASLSNSQCTITGNGASSIATGNNLTITIPTSFAFAFSGAKTVFGFAFDNASVGSGWITTGSWTVPSSGGAAVVSAAPASGSGSAQTFSLTVADGAGAANISSAYFLINSSLSAASGCFVEVNRTANTFRLQNDAGSGWLGPITLGSNASLSNSQCTITGNGASSIATGNNLTITIPTSFAFAFSGAKTVFAFAFDNASVGSGWITTGSWTVPSSGGAAVVSVVPASGSGLTQTFSLTVADGAGAANISLAYFLINSSLSAASGCFVEVNRAANTFRLENDSGTSWLGPTAIGTGTALVNSQCTVSAAGASTSSSGNNLTVNIPVTFTAGFAGLKSVFGFAFDNANVGSGWVTTGSWNP